MIKDNIKLLPEWAAQDAVMLTWPHAKTDWKPYLEDITKVYVEMVKQIIKYEDVLIVTPDGEKLCEQLDDLLSADLPHDILVVEAETNDTWARDHGFITLKDKHGQLRFLDFCFNGWGEKFEASLDNEINQEILWAEVLNGQYVDHLDFVLEGGSIETDGEGTLLTTTHCLTAPHRNQPLEKDEIEQRLKRYLHCSRVLWLDHGDLEGDDTDGHIDTLARMAPNDTIVYVQCTDTEDSHYEELNAMEQDLQKMLTAKGEPYRLLPLPMAKAIYDDGENLYSEPHEDAERLPATYANYLVINGAVLMPTYNDPENDKNAAEVLSVAFPGRKIIGVDCVTVVRQHGSLHCCTMQLPEGSIIRTE